MPLPLGNGKPLLLWIIDELKKSKFNCKIIVATSVNKENDILESFCDSNNVGCFRGDEENVLSRFTTIAKQEDFNCIVRLTADNPILDIEILDKVIQHHFENNNDYTSTSAMPTGMNSEVVSAKALLDIENHNISEADREHVTLFIRNSSNYKTEVYNPVTKTEFKSMRLTVDYASDYALLSLILSASNELSGLQLVEDTYAKYPWLFEANQSNIQKKQFANLDEEVKEAAAFLQQFDFKNASQILKDRK
jgi:spore coat polysaccharide biosynthesis protein SpsF